VQPPGSLRYEIPVEVRNRILMAHLTPARLAQIFAALETGLNQQGLNQASIVLGYDREGEVYGLTDLQPAIIFAVRKAQSNGVVGPPPPRLVLPGQA
jgi:hypothetical protein